MQDIPLHNYSWLSNKNTFWVGTDQQIRQAEIKADPILYQTWLNSGWNDDSIIEYTFNEHGFRTDNFDQSERIAIFGSSQTVGVGLHSYQVWPHHFSNILGIPIWNLASGTGSLDTCYRLIKYYVDKLNIKAIIMAIPEDNKFEFWSVGNIPFTINGTVHKDKTYQTISDEWYRHDNNRILNREKNLEAIKYICHQKNIPIVFFEIPEVNRYKELNPMDWSRCMCHVGPNYHKNIAEFVVDKLWPIVNIP